MADRTSAELFSIFFSMLAKNPTNENKALALEIYDKISNYDFDFYQMDADDDLFKLELAKMGVNPEYPDDGEVVIYYGQSGW